MREFLSMLRQAQRQIERTWKKVDVRKRSFGFGLLAGVAVLVAVILAIGAGTGGRGPGGSYPFPQPYGRAPGYYSGGAGGGGDLGVPGQPFPTVAPYPEGTGDHFWSSRFGAGNYNADNSQGYVNVPDYGPVGYGF